MQIRQLYVLAKKFKIPMTKLVRTAIAEYLLKHENLLLEAGFVKGRGKEPTQSLKTLLRGNKR